MSDGHLCHGSCVCSEPWHDQPAPPEDGLRERPAEAVKNGRDLLDGTGQQDTP